jgi:hypothetical protein
MGQSVSQPEFKETTKTRIDDLILVAALCGYFATLFNYNNTAGWLFRLVPLLTTVIYVIRYRHALAEYRLSSSDHWLAIATTVLSISTGIAIVASQICRASAPPGEGDIGSAIECIGGILLGNVASGVSSLYLIRRIMLVGRAESFNSEKLVHWWGFCLPIMIIVTLRVLGLL